MKVEILLGKPRLVDAIIKRSLVSLAAGNLPFASNRKQKMSDSTDEATRLAAARSKPFIVICGCTGTGKTKLSIQLAEWLVQSGKKAEIINADAMQACPKIIFPKKSGTERISKHENILLALQRFGYYYKQSDQGGNEGH